MKLFFLRAVLCVLLLTLPYGSAQAVKYTGGESYAAPDFRDLTQTMILMGGMPIENDKVVDEYAKMNYCDVYKEKFHNDFEWVKFRNLLIQKVQSKKEYFRVLYEISGVVYLGRYNLDTQDFPFIKDSALVNVGSLQLYSLVKTRQSDAMKKVLCEDTRVSTVFPDFYVFELNQPRTFDRLKLPMEEAKKLLARMERTGNTDRRLYVRFRLKVISVNPIAVRSGNLPAYLRGEMTGIDLFLDREMTQPFATVEVK